MLGFSEHGKIHNLGTFQAESRGSVSPGKWNAKKNSREGLELDSTRVEQLKHEATPDAL